MTNNAADGSQKPVVDLELFKVLRNIVLRKLLIRKLQSALANIYNCKLRWVSVMVGRKCFVLLEIFTVE